MKKFIKLTLILTFFSLAIILFFSNNVFATATKDDADTLIKEIAPDGENIVIKAKEPTSFTEADFLLTGYLGNLLQLDGCGVYVWSNSMDSYDSITIQIQTDDYSSTWDNGKEVVLSGWLAKYTLNVTYDEPKSNSVVDGYFSKLNNSDMSDPSKYYFVEDLSLINYYLTSDKSELWNSGAPGRALKYSTLNNVTSGSNVTYYIDVRAGMQDETLMYESAWGPMSIFYNGYSYGAKEEGIYLKRVIYIPQDTENTKDAFVAAAQKRINDYLGNSSVVVSYGGLLSSLPEGSEDEGYPITSDGNYYNIKIGSRTYKFYIVKGTDEQLVEPTYVGLDLKSKIEIASEDSSIPLDTSLTVKNVKDTSIKDKIGTENYKSYDISLYSDAKSAKVEKLENGKFTVKIPVPTELNGKELVVYYITTTGEKEEHEVTIKDGYAIFTTDHFSIYTLAEKKVIEETPDNTPTDTPTETPDNTPAKDEKDETPKTGTIDIISYILLVTIISVLGIVVLKKKETK